MRAGRRRPGPIGSRSLHRTLPWAVRIDPVNRPARFSNVATFHPTFLYESLWNLVVVVTLLVVERRFRLRPGRLFALYVTLYTFGRFFIERVRIDTASHVGGLRINEIVAIVVFGGGLAAFLWPSRSRQQPSRDLQRVANPDQ